MEDPILSNSEGLCNDVTFATDPIPPDVTTLLEILVDEPPFKDGPVLDDWLLLVDEMLLNDFPPLKGVPLFEDTTRMEDPILSNADGLCNDVTFATDPIPPEVATLLEILADDPPFKDGPELDDWLLLVDEMLFIEVPPLEGVPLFEDCLLVEVKLLLKVVPPFEGPSFCTDFE